MAAHGVNGAGQLTMLVTADGTILSVNHVFVRESGFAVSEAVGSKVTILKSGRYRPRLYREMLQSLAAGRIWSNQVTNRTRSGKKFRVAATVIPIRDRLGTVAHYLASGQLVENSTQKRFTN